MTSLEIRVAALQFLSLRLCAALSLDQLEDIRRSTLAGARASDIESQQMQAELLKLLDDAIGRARLKLTSHPGQHFGASVLKRTPSLRVLP